DQAAGAGLFGDESVFIQSGSDESFQAAHCEQERFVNMELFEKMLASASVVVSHGGAGTLLQVLRAGKTPIVMPRLQRYGEHVDDHQDDLVKALANEGRVIPVFEASELPAAVNQARQGNYNAGTDSAPRILKLVAEAIEELGGKIK